MRLAVTGASGLVGGQVVRAARAEGHQVVALTRDPRSVPAGADVRVVALDDVAVLAAAMTGADALVHCAAVYAYGPDRAAEVQRVNRDGTRCVVEAAGRAGVPRAVVTSSSVTCGSSPTPVARDETGRLGEEAVPAYYASKAAQEEAALSAGAEAGVDVVLALPTVVLGGPYRRLAPSNAMVLRYLLDPTRSTFPGGCNVVDARDLGEGHLLLARHGAPGERYLLGGQDLTWRMLHTMVAELAGLPGPFAEIGVHTAWMAAAAAEAVARLTGSTPLSTREEASTVGRYYWYSSAKVAALGYTPRPARAAIAASLAWLCVGDDLPRWVREGLRLLPEVRAARDLVPRSLSPTPRPPRRPAPARRRPR
ncbi:MAG TPA: NAD-dependent epimerase/dehydratase family protein [Kineosporiaceae bacterium]